MPIRASVLIVNYNGGRHLAECLAALEAQTLALDTFEVIVVDNASHDDSLAGLEERFPRATFIRHHCNAGFAEGNNIAVRRATAPIVVLLNNDTRPDPFWLEELLTVMDEHDCAAAVSKLVFAHDPTLINSGGLTILRDGRGHDLGFREPDIGQFESQRPVFAGCGAALALRRPKGDILDRSLFLYYEDLDLCWRLQLAGETILYAPRSLVLHAVGASAGEGSPVYRYYVERNRALLAGRYGDPVLAIYAFLVLTLKVPQALWRVLTGRWTWKHALAVPHAWGSYILRIPQTLTLRYLHRSWTIRRCEWSSTD